MPAVSIDHYENFPVASLLCPPGLRPAVTAIYHFARTADDLADEGDATVAERQADLRAYRQDLRAVEGGRYASAAASGRWSRVFEPLARAIQAHQLPTPLLHALLDAFEQDLVQTAYADRVELLRYCERSANPVGRLLLHLYGISDAESLRQSDAICSALQLINFWQDMSRDHPRGRVYAPNADFERHGLDRAQLLACHDSPAARELICELVDWSEGLMLSGAPLARRIPGRAGWELRFVVQGGLRILERIRAMQFATLTQRPALTAFDAPILAWRALGMKA
ncbi:squalene synthase HpnC [Burkholderiaceae bacterium UC74_6]